MQLDTWQAVLIGIISTVGVIYAARFAGKSSVKVKTLDVDAAAYERADKINAGAFGRLESEVLRQGSELKELRPTVEKLTKAFGIAMNFIEQFLLWERDGSLPPRPKIPESLKEYLDPSLIREHIRQQDRDEKAGLS